MRSYPLRLIILCSIPAFAVWLCFSSAHAQVSTPAAAIGSIRGTVRSGNVLLPGATIAATETATGKTLTTSTDVDGTYLLPAPAGHYRVTAQMAAFSPLTREAAVTDAASDVRLELELTLLSRTQQRATGGQRAGGPGRGFQTLTVQGVGADDSATIGADQASSAGVVFNGAAESVAVSGTAASITAAGMSTEELQQRMNDARQQAGFGGRGGFRGPALAFGGRGGFSANRPHGSVFYTANSSALNAAPYSLAGVAVPKPDYLQQRYGVAFGGPFDLPKIYNGGDKTFFFVNYNGTRGSNPYDVFSTVPTANERAGDFSGTARIFDPATGLPFQGNTISPERINAAALGLMRYIPQPNLTGTTRNFHYTTSINNSSDDVNLRLNRSFDKAAPGPQRRRSGNNFSVAFHFRRSHADLASPFPSTSGNTDTAAVDVPVGYTRTFGALVNSARFSFNRSRTSTRNLYAFSQDIAGGLGILGVSENPFDWGLPTISFSHFAGLRDISPALTRNQTISLSDTMIYSHGKHTLRWGGDFRRLRLNTESGTNARGSFVFTGFNTAQIVGGRAVPGTGYDFADFLLGLPQQTSVQFGVGGYHFRGNSWDAYFQDEWRLRAGLSLNLGIRYEYVSPFAETDGHIVNLDAAPGFSAVAPVLPGQTGPYSGPFPSTLVRPDRNNFAPRVGIAWSPLRRTVVRAGYGLNYNTGVYQGIVQQLAFQPPFSVVQTNVESPVVALSLQNGFPAAPAGSVTNNYGIDPNYRVGYVQIWNADIQQQITPTLVLNLDYTGTRGTHLDIIEAPNRTAGGIRIAGVQPFTWEASDGNSIAHAGSIRLRRRLQRGIAIGGTYTFSKSIDNASSIGGGATVVAQNAFDLASERGLSSFDQRHRVTADYLVALPFGHDKRWLAKDGVLRSMVGDWQWSGDWTAASGFPFTARVIGDFADVNRGTNGTLRPNVTGVPVDVSRPGILQWFNTSAFAIPASGQFGNAGRNTIAGPGTLLFNMALSKIFPLKESRILELRISASNVFNRPQYGAIDTFVNSPTFGQVLSVGAMRTVLLTARFRF